MTYNNQFENSLFSIVLFCLFIAGCSGEKETESSFQTVTIQENQLQRFLTLEKDSIAKPSDITILPNGKRAILDLESMSVMVYDKDGAFQHRFGQEGKGPGEFVNPINIQTTPQFIYISDQSRLMRHKYTFKGDFVETIPAPEKTLGFNDTQLLSDHEYLSPAQGQRGHLVVYRNIQTDSSFYFGKAMGDSIITISLEENKRQAQKGEVADMFKNNILIAASGNHYYIFLKAYGRLQKYNRKGTLLWEKQLQFAFMETVFDDYVETNKNLQIPTIRTLSYAQDMEVAGNHIYLLMGKADQMKTAIIQLSTDGAIQKQYNLENIGPAIFNFEKLPDANKLYIVDYSMGRILSLNLDAVNQTMP